MKLHAVIRMRLASLKNICDIYFSKRQKCTRLFYFFVIYIGGEGGTTVLEFVRSRENVIVMVLRVLYDVHFPERWYKLHSLNNLSK